jgi:hypothetical protein
MSLNIEKLENPRLRGGKKTYRCPACAEAGGDTKGEHLIVNDNGSFGCVVYPKNYEHRKRIFALVGDRALKTLIIRSTSTRKLVSEPKPLKTGIWGRLGRVNLYTGSYNNPKKESISPNVIETGVSPEPVRGVPRSDPTTRRSPNFLSHGRDHEAGSL